MFLYSFALGGNWVQNVARHLHEFDMRVVYSEGIPCEFSAWWIKNVINHCCLYLYAVQIDIHLKNEESLMQSSFVKQVCDSRGAEEAEMMCDANGEFGIYENSWGYTYIELSRIYQNLRGKFQNAASEIVYFSYCKKKKTRHDNGYLQSTWAIWSHDFSQ